MTAVLIAVVALTLAGWVYVEWQAERAARRLDEAVRQAEAMSAHPAGDRWAPGLPPVEDRADYP